MPPTGQQIKRLQDALLSAYPTLADLRAVVRIYLDASLDAIVPVYGQNQTEILFDLIEHYAAQPGGLHRLIEAAHAGNPGNPALAALAPEFLSIDFSLLPVKGSCPGDIWPERNKKVYGYLRMEWREPEPKTVAIQESKLTIGRHPNCTLLIPLQFERVSRVHAAIYPLNGDVYIEDLGSKNGTYIDGRKVDAPSRLYFGQHILLGADAPLEDICVIEFLQLPSSTE